MKNKQFSKLCWLVGTSFFTLASVLYAEEIPVNLPAIPQASQPADSFQPVNVQAKAEPAKPQTRLWNLQDADILSVINEVSQETGKNFVVDPRVSGKISLISSKPLKHEEVYQVFLSVLGMLGYSAIPSGNVVKIIPNMESGEQATAVANLYSPGKGDEVVVRVVPLKNVSATQLIPVLRPLLPQWANISSYSPGNVLILLGRAENLQRLVSIIQEVDEASNNSIQMIPLHYAQATQVATVLNNLQASARSSGEMPNISIAVDERSNSILLSGSKAMRLRIRVLISQLDAPAASPAGNTEVIYLRYLEAKTFAPLLGKIAQNIAGKDSGSSGVYPSASAGATTGAATAESKLMNSTLIQAEPNSNAVIVTAPPALMKALKAVIAKLDIRPAQVLVEGVIAQVDESDLKSLGIQWGSIAPNGSVQPTVVTDFAQLGAGIVGIIPSTQLRAVLSVLQNENGVDILSTPQVMILDNHKATIEIGQDVPEQTGSYATTGQTGTVTPFNTVGRKPVTLRLDVTPQINLGSSVRLNIKLKNDTLQNPQNPGLNPIINTSRIENSVIVNSDDILVLGGLMSDSNNENINKVPILGDLPGVGALFTQKTRSQSKKNLMVFIKPVIVHGSDDAMVITESRYNGIRREQSNFRDELSNIGGKALEPKLPAWDPSRELPKPFETNTR